MKSIEEVIKFVDVNINNLKIMAFEISKRNAPGLNEIAKRIDLHNIDQQISFLTSLKQFITTTTENKPNDAEQPVKVDS